MTSVMSLPITSINLKNICNDIWNRVCIYLHGFAKKPKDNTPWQKAKSEPTGRTALIFNIWIRGNLNILINAH